MATSSQLMRRRFLSAVAVIGSITLSGCSTIGGQHGATDVVALNIATAAKKVSITITDSTENALHTSQTLTLDPSEKVDPVNDGKLPTNASYTIEVTMENGPQETFEWDNPDLEQAPLWVIVDDSENIRFLLQSG